MQGRKEEAIELDEVKIIIPEGKEEVSEPPSTDGYFATIPDPIVAEIITYLSFQEAASFQTNKRLKNIIYNAPINQNVDISSARENKVTRKGTYQEVLHALSYYKEEEKKIQRFKEDISNKGNAKCGGDSVTVPGTICSIGAGLIVWSGATVGYLNSLSSVKAILAGGIYGIKENCTG